MENEDVTHEERVEFEQQMNGYLRLIEFEKIHGLLLDSNAHLRCATRSVHNLGRQLVQKPKIPVVTELHVQYIARLIDEFGWTGMPIYPMDIMFPNAAPWLDIENAANAHRVAILRPHIEEDQQSRNELIAAHDLLLQFLHALDELQQQRELLIRSNRAFVSAGAHLASEHCLPIMRADDVESVVTLINEFGYNGIPQPIYPDAPMFGYNGIPQPIYPDAPMLLEQPNREEVQVILNMVNGRFHVGGQL